MRRAMAMWAAAVACSACTYDPPVRSKTWYENPQAYPDDSSEHPRAADLQAYLDSAVREGLPGAVLLVRTPGEGTWAGAAGWADIASGVRWEPAMIARVGSVSKMFSAAVVLQVCEEHDVSLATPARELLPSEITRELENADRATIAQLLQHTSGIFNYLESTELFYEATGSYDYEYRSKEKLMELAYGEEAEFDPGTSWGYSNTPFLLLELVAERLEGRPSEQLMRSLVIEPLALRSTSYQPSGPAPSGIVRGYADIFADGALIDSTDTELERFHFDGGVVSNVYDLADFLDALLDGTLLSDDARTQLLDVVPTGGHSERGTDFYGAGLIIEDHPELGRIVGHSGTALGYSAHLYRVEDYGITFAAIVNGSQHAVEDRSYRWFSPLEHDDIVRLVVDGQPRASR
jgi:D-alanyl-D-alanine carboxypeptidase